MGLRKIQQVKAMQFDNRLAVGAVGKRRRPGFLVYLNGQLSDWCSWGHLSPLGCLCKVIRTALSVEHLAWLVEYWLEFYTYLPPSVPVQRKDCRVSHLTASSWSVSRIQVLQLFFPLPTKPSEICFKKIFFKSNGRDLNV